MSDFYTEQLVKRQTPAASRILQGVLILLTACSVCLAFFMPAAVLLILVMGTADFFVFRRLNVEYEYLYVNGTLEVDKIMSRSKRKHVFEMALSDLEILAPAGSPELRQYQGIRPADFSSGLADAGRYEMIILKDGMKTRIIFEPNASILEGMKMMAPRKVLI